MQNTDSDLLSTGAVARILEKSESTVRKYDRDGRLASSRVNATLRVFRRADVERLRAELAAGK